MGADTKELRLRIKSVDSTLHLTKAMGLVASSKIRRATANMLSARSYCNALNDTINKLTLSRECEKSPYMRLNGEKTKIIVVAGDRGLAGGYNANVFRLCNEYDATFIPIGKRACEKFGGKLYSSENFTVSDGYELAEKLCEEFANGEFDKLGIISSEYVSIMTQNAVIKWVLPLTKSEDKSNASTVFEPDELSVLNMAVTEYVSGMITGCVRESFACEVAARRMAMDSAGKNAKQMIDDLQLKYNRARQGAITQEITEIVAGS